jgi:elongation factor Ts
VSLFHRVNQPIFRLPLLQKQAYTTAPEPQQKVPIQLIKELRSRTGVGLNDCRDALIATSHDVEKAIQLLKEKGQTSADRISRKTGEGLVLASADSSAAVLLEVNSDTDFVARTEDFKNFSKAVLNATKEFQTEESFANIETNSLLNATWNSDTLATRRKELEKILGESILVSRALKIKANPEQNEIVGAYQHGTSGKYAGAVLIKRTSGTENDEQLQRLANLLAVQVVAGAPKSINVEKDAATDSALVEQEFLVWEEAGSNKPPLVKDVLNKLGVEVTKIARWVRGETL